MFVCVSVLCLYGSLRGEQVGPPRRGEEPWPAPSLMRRSWCRGRWQRWDHTDPTPVEGDCVSKWHPKEDSRTCHSVQEHISLYAIHSLLLLRFMRFQTNYTSLTTLNLHFFSVIYSTFPHFWTSCTSILTILFQSFSLSFILPRSPSKLTTIFQPTVSSFNLHFLTFFMTKHGLVVWG